MGRKATNKAIGEAVANLMNAAFEHGRTAERLEAAEVQHQAAFQLVDEQVDALRPLIFIPSKKEIN